MRYVAIATLAIILANSLTACRPLSEQSAALITPLPYPTATQLSRPTPEHTQVPQPVPSNTPIAETTTPTIAPSVTATEPPLEPTVDVVTEQLQHIKELGSLDNEKKFAKYYTYHPELLKPLIAEEINKSNLPQDLIDSLSTSGTQIAGVTEAVKNGLMKGKERQGLYPVFTFPAFLRPGMKFGAPGSISGKEYKLKNPDRPIYTVGEIVSLTKVGKPNQEVWILTIKDQTGSQMAYWYTMGSPEYGSTPTGILGISIERIQANEENFLAVGEYIAKSQSEDVKIGPELPTRILTPGRSIIVSTDPQDQMLDVRDPFYHAQRTSLVMVFDSQENIEAQRCLLLTADNKRTYYVK